MALWQLLPFFWLLLLLLISFVLALSVLSFLGCCDQTAKRTTVAASGALAGGGQRGHETAGGRGQTRRATA